MKQSVHSHGHRCSLLLTDHMALAGLRHQAARSASWAFIAGAGCSAAARSKCAAASLSSAAERGPASQELDRPASTTARIRWASPLHAS